MRKPTAATLLSVLILLGYALFAQQTIIITPGPPGKSMTLTGPLTIHVIPQAPGAPPSAPTITTASPLPDGDEDVAYSVNLDATGGTLPYSWSLVATDTLPETTEVWTPASGDLAFTETFGDSAACAATDNVWPTPAGLVLDNTGKLTGNCSGSPAGVDTLVSESGIGVTHTWLSFELIFDTLPTSSTAMFVPRSATDAVLGIMRFATSTFLSIQSQPGTAVEFFQPAADTRYLVELYGERGEIAANAKWHARIATWTGASYGAFGSWFESGDGTWTEQIDKIRWTVNNNGGTWYIDTIKRCQFGPVSEDFCGAGAPDLYSTPSPVPNNVYVDGTTPISESLWSHDGTDLTLEIATDPDLSTIEVAEKPGGTLTLSQAGVLSGTPTASGTLNFTARVCDDAAQCSTKAFSLDINAPPDPEPPGPWVSSFTPVRTHYIVASGGCTTGGTCGEIGNPETFGTANGHDTCGDLHVFRAGTYNLASQLGNITWGPNLNCTSGAPSVWKAYVDPATGQPERAATDGSIRPTGSHQWFVDIEALQTADTNLYPFNIRGSDMKIINAVTHDSNASSNIGSFGHARTIVYGTSSWRAGVNTPDGAPSHALYTSGDCSGGTKYFVHNIFQENVAGNTNSRYTLQLVDNTTNGVNCYHIEESFFGDGQPGQESGMLTATNGDGLPLDNVTFNKNWMVDLGRVPNTSVGVSVSLGSTRPGPGVYTITDNYFARSNIGVRHYWGDSGAHDPFVFTGNEIYDPVNDTHILLETRGVAGSQGSHKIFNVDTWNNNTYGGTFNASLWCNGTQNLANTLTQWRDGTDNCRVTPDAGNANGFDLSSTTVADPTVDKVRVIQNQYKCPTCTFTDGDWGFVHCVNWDGNTTCEADISSVVGFGKTYTVKYSRDPYGTSAASGTCPGSGACNVSLPTRRTSAEATGEFTNAYLIWGQP